MLGDSSNFILLACEGVLVLGFTLLDLFTEREKLFIHIKQNACIETEIWLLIKNRKGDEVSIGKVVKALD